MRKKAFLVDLSEEDRKMLKEYGKMRGWSESKTLRVCFRAAILIATGGAMNIEAGIQKSIYMDNGEKI